jgi:hypothetical protein
MDTTTIDPGCLTTVLHLIPEGVKTVSVEVDVEPGFEGSHSFNAPSDIDFYGAGASIEDVGAVTYVMEDGSTLPATTEVAKAAIDWVFAHEDSIASELTDNDDCDYDD